MYFFVFFFFFQAEDVIRDYKVTGVQTCALPIYYDQHSRTDNGQGINNQVVYQVTSSNINFGNFTYPTGMPSNQGSNFNTYYSYVLGMVAQSQVVYTRSGSNLTLGPIGASALAQSVIPYYNSYSTDTWH